MTTLYDTVRWLVYHTFERPTPEPGRQPAAITYSPPPRRCLNEAAHKQHSSVREVARALGHHG